MGVLRSRVRSEEHVLRQPGVTASAEHSDGSLSQTLAKASSAIRVVARARSPSRWARKSTKSSTSADHEVEDLLGEGLVAVGEPVDGLEAAKQLAVVDLDGSGLAPGLEGDIVEGLETEAAR